MFSVSVLNNTNKVISSSQDDLSYIREGSFLKIGEDSVLYTIGNTNKIYYLKDFEVLSPKNIIINDDGFLYLQKKDTLKISYREYELDTITEIKTGGKFYAIGDIIVVKGDSSVDLDTGMSNPTKLIVEQVNENGGIKQLGLKYSGRYIIPPNGDCEILGGHGEGAVLNLKYESIETRKTMERTIEDLQFKDNKTFITLNYPLYNGIKKGRVSLEKWEITLTSDYVSGTKINSKYEIYKDFTPNLKLPLLVKNSQSQELVFNRAMQILEKEIMELKKKTH